MKIFIPTIGTKLILAKPWTFNLHDEYRNEKFWKVIHGERDREVYYYGYGPSGHETSPVPTTVCKTQAHRPAKPKATTFPKGTELFIERFYIRRGNRGFDSISFRIYKGGYVPAGRFWAKLDEINGKLDATVEVVNKWPEGKFALNIVEGKTYQCKTCGKSPGYGSHTSPHYCQCAVPRQPRYRTNVLSWIDDPDNSSWRSTKSAAVVHKTDEEGLDDLLAKPDRGYNSSDGYSKTFTDMEALISWARKKNFTDAHIDAFIHKYEEKKAVVV